MKLTAFLLVLFVSLTQAVKSPEKLTQLFEEWRQEYGFQNRFTVASEYAKRLAIFSANVLSIDEHNSGNHSWTQAVNEFAHLSPVEFSEMYTGYESRQGNAEYMTIPRESFKFEGTKKNLPKQVDWTTTKAVSEVKNQGQCGSCWSFSTTGGMEGAYFKKTGKSISFSEQQLVSCDKTDNGCGGGIMDNAFKWIEKNGGLCAESDYPYTSGAGANSACSSKCSAVKGSKVTSYVDVSKVPEQVPCSEDTMMAAVAQQPISVAIQANTAGFQFYSGGVMTSKCGTQLDHGVLVVGYGVEDGKNYWKVKNSWGASWGMKGYINLERGVSQKGGQCGVLLSACYPKL